MSELPRREARNQVRTIQSAEEIGEHVREMLGKKVRKSNTNVLKIAEYALLVHPLTQGLHSYLDKLKIRPAIRPVDPRTLIETTSLGVTQHVLREIRNDPNHSLINKISWVRRFKRVGYWQLIGSISSTVTSAARASASAMYGAAATNGLVIHTAGDPNLREHDTFIEAIKRSTGLPLARPLVHLEQLEASFDAIDSLGASYLIEGLDSPNFDNLAYDHDQRRAVLKEPLGKWVSNGQAIGETALSDVQVGCPVSFDPQLVIRYYQMMCDKIEAVQAWPPTFALPPGSGTIAQFDTETSI